MRVAVEVVVDRLVAKAGITWRARLADLAPAETPMTASAAPAVRAATT